MTKPKRTLSPLKIVAGRDGDPIFAAIDRHKAAAAVWSAAVDVRASFPESADPMTEEQWVERDRLDDAEAAARAPLVAAGVHLVTTVPTTLAGIIELVPYIRIQMRNDAFMPYEIEFEFEYDADCPGDAVETMRWIDAFLNTIAEAAAALDHAGGV